MDTPLLPFVHFIHKRPYTSDDLVNIANLGYSYAPCSLDKIIPDKASALLLAKEYQERNLQRVSISGINRARIAGSFLVAVYEHVGNEHIFVGLTSVLSRWNVETCKNCTFHLDTSVCLELPESSAPIGERIFTTVLITRKGRIPDPTHTF
jgi:tyrosinase